MAGEGCGVAVGGVSWNGGVGVEEEVGVVMRKVMFRRKA